MEIDTSKWSGDGDFTRRVLDALGRMGEVVQVRVEDAPASRAEQGYAFLSNEIYVRTAERERVERAAWLGVLTRRRRVRVPAVSMEELAAALAAAADVGPADYVDEGMIQYLKAERVIPPYQTRGYKLVEMVRLYRLGGQPRREEAPHAER